VCNKKPEELITLFYRADLRVGKILTAAKHPESEKLYIESIDMGNGEI
jgi:tRNA-binding EMAP/Myf-like protein